MASLSPTKRSAEQWREYTADSRRAEAVAREAIASTRREQESAVQLRQELQRRYVELVADDSVVMHTRCVEDTELVASEALLDRDISRVDEAVHQLSEGSTDAETEANELRQIVTNLGRERHDLLNSIDECRVYQNNHQQEEALEESQIGAAMRERRYENAQLREELAHLESVEREMRQQAAKSVIRLKEEEENYKQATNTSRSPSRERERERESQS